MIELVANFVPKEHIVFSTGIVNDEVRLKGGTHGDGQHCIKSFRSDFSGIFIVVSQIFIEGLKRGSIEPLLPLISPQDLPNLLQSGESIEIFTGIKLSFATIPYDLRGFLRNLIEPDNLPEKWEVEENVFTVRLLAQFLR
jgi:hypothetical protein